MGTLNKLIRKEARATFWSLAKVDFRPRVFQDFHDSTFCAPTYVALLERFLRGLGDDGRFGVRAVRMHVAPCCETCGHVPQDLTEAGHLAFAQVCSMLLECVALTTLKITVAEQYLFHNEQAALEDVLLHGKPLNRQGPRSFQSLLQSLPKLQAVEIDAPTYINIRHFTSKMATPFARYAFTGYCRYNLWKIIKAILEGTKLQTVNGKIKVKNLPDFFGGGDELTYEQWLATQDSMDNFSSEISELHD